MSPKVSIIIPTFNPDRYLLDALCSILCQSYKNTEIIIVDDGSKNSVEDLLRKCMYLDKVKLIRQENKGAPAARNRGFKEAVGEYIIFWDDDVVGESCMIEKMVEALEQKKEASFAYSNFYYGFKKMPAREFDVEELKKNNYIITTSLIRSKDFPGFDEKLKRFQDWDLWLAMAENGKKGEWINEYLFRAAPKKAGISTWLPKFAYKKPWKSLPFFKKKVLAYEKAKEIVRQKHNLV